MKRRLLSFVILCLTVCAGPGWAQLAPEADSVRVAAKTVRTEKAMFAYKGTSWAEGARVPSSEVNYDREGRVTDSLSFKSDGSLFKKYAAVYDGEKIREETYYNPKGTIDEKFTVEYSPDGGTAELKQVDAKGAIKERQVYKLDASGQVVEYTTYDSKGAAQGRVVITADAGGKLKERATFKSDGKLAHKEVTYYGANGRESETHRYGADGVARSKSLLKHDDKGENISEIVQGPHGYAEMRYEYEYNDQGHWIKKTTSIVLNENGVKAYRPMEVDYRNITYYPDASKQSPRKKEGSPGRNAPVVAGAVIGSNTEKPAPAYPEEVKRAGKSGKVETEVWINEHGRVFQVCLVSDSDRRLFQAAALGAFRWVWNPSLVAGVPVRVQGTISFNFKL